jgi:molecular chaperone GrpE
MTMNNPRFDHNGNPQPAEENPQEETLAQRSARLEAEAAAGIFSQPETPPAGDSAETERLLGIIKGLQAELDKNKDQMLRALADAENARKRSVKEREDASRFAISGFARDLLSVADNLRRALEAIPAEAMAADPHLKNLNDGVEATERELLKSFEKNGLRKINPAGEPFNPNFHEVMYEAAGTGKPAGTVIQVMEAGYVLNDRLLRPARVAVAKDEGQGNGSRPGGQIDTQA